MNYRPIIIFIINVIFAVSNSWAFYPTYYFDTTMLPAPPETFDQGWNGFINPAMASTVHHSMFQISGISLYAQPFELNQWGMFAAIPHFSAGIASVRLPGSMQNVRDVRWQLGFGDGVQAWGLGAGRQSLSGSPAYYGTAGWLMRPNRWLSFGASTIFNASLSQWLFRCASGYRPFGDERWTVFAGISQVKLPSSRYFSWRIGSISTVVPGIALLAQFNNEHVVSIGMSVSFGNVRILSHSLKPPKGRSAITNSIRWGGYERNWIDLALRKKSRFVTYELRKGVGYRTYRFFSRTEFSLMNLLSNLDIARTDPTVAGILLNLTNMHIPFEMVWEIRQKVQQLRKAGKYVVTYFHNADLNTYYLASVADKIVMGPMGVIQFNGVLMGRTYYRNLLDKLGVGFQEWRLYSHKTANETFSRTTMSDADREQRFALIQAKYQTIREDICLIRQIEGAQFDTLIDRHFIMTAKEARANGLVDMVLKWNELKKVIRGVDGRKKSFISARHLADRALPKTKWGPVNKIALVYALGLCDTEKGIQARRLEHILTKLATDERYKAVVMRVDSPGGDGYASDLVASAMKRCREKKPVIVSQGQVAASGGYWISMNADTIVAAPFTITGSIGVAGGWFWNKSLDTKIGMTTDHVKIGKHADLGFGLQLPFIGQPIPMRNLTIKEQQQVEHMMQQLYDLFVNKVAQSRSLRKEKVLLLAQGRVWSGLAAQKNGLVDIIGGLDTAIGLAKRKIGLQTDEAVEIDELPHIGMINPEAIVPSVPGVYSRTIELPFNLRYLMFLQRFSGQALPIVAPEFLLFD